MKIINRPFYLDRLVEVIGTPDIKVITGIRRSGKSELLKLFKKYVKKEVAKQNIINIDLSLPQNEKYRDSGVLFQYIESKYKKGKNNFVLVDEVQLCSGFENLFSGLHDMQKYDIYLTGSNAFILSSDLATLFGGRTYEIAVFPFSLAEYMQYFKLTDADEALSRYLREGGISGSYLYKTENSKYSYLRGIYDALIIKDIVLRHRVKNSRALGDISNFLMDNIGNVTSIRNITRMVSGQQDEEANRNTNSRYLSYLCESFAFYPVRRYDTVGKKYLKTSEKYYMADHSFRYAMLGTRNMDYGRSYENIVAIELLRRGYEIYTGNGGGSKEIDFIAVKGSEKFYIQVADDISNEDTFTRETSSLLSVRDAYPKIILANTHHETYQYQGIQVINLATWLSEQLLLK